MLYEALLVQYKYGHTQKISSMYDWTSNVRYKRERELEIVDQSQTIRYVSRVEPLLYVPTFTQKDFHYISTQDPPIQGTSTEDYNSTLEVHNSTLKYNHLYSRGKAQSQKTISSTQEG